MICCIDGSNLFFIAWAIFCKETLAKNGEDYVIKEEDLGLFYHMIFKKFMEYFTTYSDIVLCFEGEHSSAWRKEQFPVYKENRKKDSPNYKWVGPLIENTIKFLSNFHCKILKVPYCEGDDCIYQTCKYYSEKEEQVLIISSDKDLSQMMNYWDTVSQYNPIKKDYIKKNPNILLEKALIGDPSDNIKVFRGLGPKTFEKMMADKEFYNKKMPPENLILLDKVMQIIDLRKYPEKYQNAIKEELDKPWNEFKIVDIEKFLLDNGLKSCYNDWTNSWCSEIQSLSFEQPDAFDEIMDLIK